MASSRPDGGGGPAPVFGCNPLAVPVEMGGQATRPEGGWPDGAFQRQRGGFFWLGVSALRGLSRARGAGGRVAAAGRSLGPVAKAGARVLIRHTHDSPHRRSTMSAMVTKLDRYWYKLANNSHRAFLFPPPHTPTFRAA